MSAKSDVCMPANFTDGNHVCTCRKGQQQGRSQEFAIRGTKEGVWGTEIHQRGPGAAGRAPVEVWGRIRRSRRHMLNIRLNKIHKNQHSKNSIL